MPLSTVTNNRGMGPKASRLGPLFAGLLAQLLWGLCHPAPSEAAGRQQLQGHRAYGSSGAPLVGRHPARAKIRLALCLPPRNTQAMEDLLKSIYDPHNPLYRHYLNPGQFAEMFGPSARDYGALKAFAVAHRLKVTAAYANRLVLDVTGATQDIEGAY